MLNWSIRLFRIAGIQLAVHFTFFLLLAYAAWEGWQSAISQGLSSTDSVLSALGSAGCILIFFIFVILHELGHAFAAMRYGIRVPRILLLPIGGMAQMDSIPRTPKHELVIAIAGPAVNFAFVVLLFLITPSACQHIFGLAQTVLSQSPDQGVEIESGAIWLPLLLIMNLLMGCFNLIPIFPMDGGRVLRALLATRFPYVKATFIAATVAKILAGLGIILALYASRYQLVILLSFIFVVGEMEYRMVKRREIEEERWRRALAELTAAALPQPTPSPNPPKDHS